MDSTCRSCHADLKPNASFCHVCGAPVVEELGIEDGVRQCDACAAELKPGAAFCDRCGLRVGDAMPEDGGRQAVAESFDTTPAPLPSGDPVQIESQQGVTASQDGGISDSALSVSDAISDNGHPGTGAVAVRSTRADEGKDSAASRSRSRVFFWAAIVGVCLAVAAFATVAAVLVARGGGVRPSPVDSDAAAGVPAEATSGDSATARGGQSDATTIDATDAPSASSQSATVFSPARGTPERAEMMDAIREYLNNTDYVFMVPRIRATADWAIVEAYPTKATAGSLRRMFYVLERYPGGWGVAASTPVSSADAFESLQSDSGVPDYLVNDFTSTASDPSAK